MLHVDVASVVIPDGHRELHEPTVKLLVRSIAGIGLLHPITVHKNGEYVLLVAGRHRLEAYRRLGHDTIAAVNTCSRIEDDDDKSEADIFRELVEIEENICRVDVNDKRAARKRIAEAHVRLKELHDEQERREAAERERAQTGQEGSEYWVNVNHNSLPGEPTKEKSKKQRRAEAQQNDSRGRPRNPAVEAVVEATGVSKSTAKRDIKKASEAVEQAPEHASGRPMVPKRETRKSGEPKVSKPKVVDDRPWWQQVASGKSRSVLVALCDVLEPASADGASAGDVLAFIKEVLQ